MRLDGPELEVDRLSRPRRQELRRKCESREAERNAEVPEPIGREPEIGRREIGMRTPWTRRKQQGLQQEEEPPGEEENANDRSPGHDQGSTRHEEAKSARSDFQDTGRCLLLASRTEPGRLGPHRAPRLRSSTRGKSLTFQGACLSGTGFSASWARGLKCLRPSPSPYLEFGRTSASIWSILTRVSSIRRTHQLPDGVRRVAHSFRRRFRLRPFNM